MKLLTLFLLLSSFGFATPKATLDAAESFIGAVGAELPKAPAEKKDKDRVLAIRVDIERLRRVISTIETKWSFSRRSGVKKEIVEVNRLSTLSDLRTLSETSEVLLGRVREIVLDSRRERIEGAFTSLRGAISAYQRALVEGRYP